MGQAAVPFTYDSCETLLTAVRMTSATTWGCEIIMACEAATSVMVAPARSAMKRSPDGPMMKSLGEMTAHAGSDFQAGSWVGSPNETPARGRCETARIA